MIHDYIIDMSFEVNVLVKIIDLKKVVIMHL